jgi:hypothetical protein
VCWFDTWQRPFGGGNWQLTMAADTVAGEAEAAIASALEMVSGFNTAEEARVTHVTYICAPSLALSPSRPLALSLALALSVSLSLSLSLAMSSGPIICIYL